MIFFDRNHVQRKETLAALKFFNENHVQRKETLAAVKKYVSSDRADFAVDVSKTLEEVKQISLSASSDGADFIIDNYNKSCPCWLVKFM